MHPIAEDSAAVEAALLVFDRLVDAAEQLEGRAAADMPQTAASAFFRGEAAGYRHAAGDLRHQFLSIATRRRDPLAEGVFSGRAGLYVVVGGH